jgi:uroporphyrinogen decarboxylase
VARLPSGVFPIDRYSFEDMLTGMIDQPERIHRVLERETAYNLVAGERMLEAGCDAIMDLSDVAGNNGPFMSPKMFETFLCPHLQSQAELAHGKGAFFLKHTDGNMWRLLDPMIEAGVDGWHGIQPGIGMNLPRLQDRFGGRICFFGGVDVDTLIRGSEEDVEREVRVAVESAPKNGGLVLASGNTLMVGVKYTNYLAMLRAAASFRG